MQLGLWSRLPLYIKLLTSEPWRGKINMSCQSFGCTARGPGWQNPFFWIGSIDALSLKSEGTLPVRNCLLKFFEKKNKVLWYWKMPLATQNPMSSALKALNTDTTSIIQPLALRTFKAHYTWYSMERIVNAVEENANRENITKIWKDYIIEDIIAVIEKVW